MKLRRIRSTQSKLGNSRLAAFLLVACFFGSECDAFDCSRPFNCTISMIEQLSMTPFSQWYTFPPSTGKKEYASTWMENSAACCKHCVWNLGYPLFDPIMLASDRTVNRNAQKLDCFRFQVPFTSLPH